VNYALGSEVMIVGARDKVASSTGTLTTYILESLRIVEGLEPGAKVLIVHARPHVYIAAVNEAVRHAAEAGVEVSVAEKVSIGRNTLKADVAKIVRVAETVEPDVVIVVADDGLAGEAVKALYGRIPLKLVIAAGISSPRVFLHAAGATQSQDVLVVTDWLADGALTPDDAVHIGLPFTGPTLEVFQQYLKERCPALHPSAIAARAAAALIFLVHSVQKANSFDPARVREAAVSYGITTFYGPILVDGVTGLSKMPPVMVGQWEAGKLRYLGHAAHVPHHHAPAHTTVSLESIRYPSPQWSEARPQTALEQPEAAPAEEAEGGGDAALLAAAAGLAIILVLAATVAIRRRG